MGRYRINAGRFGPGPGQAEPGTRRINLGAFGPGEEQRQAQELFDTEEANLQGETPNGLGRNIVAAGRMRALRDAEMLQGRPQSRSIGGPLPDPAWDAFFGALQDKEQRAGDAGMRFNARPAIRNLGGSLIDNTSSMSLEGLKKAQREESARKIAAAERSAHFSTRASYGL